MIKVAQNFKINSNDLVFFFHYMPSIFQLHLHCCLKDNYHATNLSRGVYYYDTVINGLKKDIEVKSKTFTRLVIEANDT